MKRNKQIHLFHKYTQQLTNLELNVKNCYFLGSNCNSNEMLN